MKLKILNINFKSRDEFLENTKKEILGEGIPKKNELIFDSIETFKRVMGQNKLEILMAISRLSPDSIYGLKKLLNREYPHVLKDCRQLESLGLIQFVKSEGAKRQLRPILVFEYDLIRVNSDIEEIFPISERSNRILLEAKVG